MEQNKLNKNTNQINPLVSVIVMTYNSAKFILETLESAKAQSYPNIELIVSDDGSDDNTIELCRDWIEDNKNIFARTKVIVVDKNTGIPANCNRGLNAATGVWIKFIAGDDILFDNAINLIFEEVLKYPDDQFFFSKGIVFEKVNGKEIIYDYLLPKDIPKKVANNKLDYKGQYKWLLLKNYIFSPSTFIKKEVFDKVGGFDEKYPLFEDYPFFLKCVKKGIRSVFLPIITVKYRVHYESVFHNNQDKFMLNTKFKKYYNAFLDEEILPNTTTFHKIGISGIRFFENIVIKMGNKRNITNRIIMGLGIYANPFFIYLKLKIKFT